MSNDLPTSRSLAPHGSGNMQSADGWRAVLGRWCHGLRLMLLLAATLAAVSTQSRASDCSTLSSNSITASYDGPYEFDAGDRITLSAAPGNDFTIHPLRIYFGASVDEVSNKFSNNQPSITYSSSSSYTFDLASGQTSAVWATADSVDVNWTYACIPATNTTTVSSVSPASGSIAGGTSVTISGAHLTEATSVSFGGTPVSGFAVNGSTITAVTPAHAAGTVAVSVSTPSGGTGTLAGAFTYATVPGAPTGVTATTGLTDATVSFTPPANNGGDAITKYVVTSNPGGKTAEGPSSPLTITGLTPATSYTFTVTATNAIGPSVASSASGAATTKSTQTITFANPGAQNFGTAPMLTATLDSGLAPTFTSATPGVCTITTGGALTFVGAGSCTIKADQAGNGTYGAATTVTQTFAVNAVAPGAPTVGTATAGNTTASVSFTAPASNGGAAINSYTVTSNPGGLSATGGASPLTVTGLANGTSYTFTVTATNAASLTGLASTASNPVVPKGDQTITFANPGAQYFGTAPTLAATATSGLTVSFTSSTTSVCTITTGGALTYVSTGNCTINADQAGDTAFNAATTVTQSFAVNAVAPGAPSIGTATAGDGQASVSFTAPASTGGTAITTYTVTSNPGGLSATGVASPLTVSGLTNGTSYTFTVTATNQQALTGLASSSSNPVVPRTGQTITFANPGAQNFGTSPTLTATSSSLLPVSFTSATTGVCTITTGGALTFVSAGSCTINADQAGNGAYIAAPQASQTFTVNAVVPGAPIIGTATAGDGSASVSFTAPASNGGAAISSYIVTSSPGNISVTGGSSPLTVTGLSAATSYSFTVRATNSVGNSPASAASNPVTPLAGQTINFADPGAQLLASGTLTLVATASSNLAVTFTSGSPAVCTVSGTTVTFVAAGNCTINADQAGNGGYLAAPTVTRIFAVNGAPPVAGNVSFTVEFDSSNNLVPLSLGGGTATSVAIAGMPSHGTATAWGTTIRYTPATGYSGPDSFGYTATNGGGTSGLATVSITVNAARPDPAQDQAARAIVTSQAATASRVGQRQIANTIQRLEQLHDEGERSQAGGGRPMTATADDVMGGSLVRPAGGSYATSMLAYGDDKAPSSKTDPGEAASQILGKVSQAFEETERQAELPFHLWSAGSIDWGRGGEGSDQRFTTSGLTFGVDRRLTDSLTMGLAGGVAVDRTRFGRDTSDGTAYTAQLYASLKLALRTWLDMVGGYGKLQFDSERWSGGGLLTGDRDGSNLFGSVGLSSACELSGLKLTGYGRLDIVRMALDGYSESGSPSWTLAYDTMDSTTLTGVAGLRASYAIPMDWGTLTPGGRIEYRHALEGGFTQNLGYADTGGFGSSISGEAISRDAAGFGLSLDATTLDGLDLNLEYRLSADGDGIGSQQVRAAARLPF